MSLLGQNEYLLDLCSTSPSSTKPENRGSDVPLPSTTVKRSIDVYMLTRRVSS